MLRRRRIPILSLARAPKDTADITGTHLPMRSTRTPGSSSSSPRFCIRTRRYYTLGKGEFGKRIGYAFSRVVITRTDSGHRDFNYSEILGAGAFSGIANLYYPSGERTVTKTYQRWITNLCIDGGVFVFKEVWPDINNAVFHQKD